MLFRSITGSNRVARPIVGMSSKGRTGDFGSLYLGSNPSIPTKSFPCRLMVGQQTLDLLIFVRVEAREPVMNRKV